MHATETEYCLTQLTMALYYALVVIGLSLLMGYAGQVSLGHGAFFAIGGYTSAVLTTYDFSRFKTAGWASLLNKAGFMVGREDLSEGRFSPSHPGEVFWRRWSSPSLSRTWSGFRVAFAGTLSRNGDARRIDRQQDSVGYLADRSLGWNQRSARMEDWAGIGGQREKGRTGPELTWPPGWYCWSWRLCETWSIRASAGRCRQSTTAKRLPMPWALTPLFTS